MNTKLLVGGGVVAAVLLYLGFRKPSGLKAGPVSAINGSVLHLQAQRYYAGRLQAGNGMPAPFSATADEETIGKGLAALGFSDIKIYMNAQALPESGLKPALVQGAGETSRFFTGMWGGLTADVPRPAQVEALYVKAPPSLEAKRAQGLA